MKKWFAVFIIAGIFFSFLKMPSVQAAQKKTYFGMISLSGTYSKKNFGNSSYYTYRRYTGSFAYALAEITELELSYVDAKSFFNQDPYQTVTTKEQILSLSILQLLVPPTWPFQPYVKAGAAQYNRKEAGTVLGIPTRERYTKDPSAVLGAGLRIYFLQNFSFKIEAVTYLPNFHITEIDRNFAIEGGLGWRF